MFFSNLLAFKLVFHGPQGKKKRGRFAGCLGLFGQLEEMPMGWVVYEQ